MIETSFKNSQNQNFKLYKNSGVLLLGYAPLLGITRNTGIEGLFIIPLIMITDLKAHGNAFPKSKVQMCI